MTSSLNCVNGPTESHIGSGPDVGILGEPTIENNGGGRDACTTGTANGDVADAASHTLWQ
ncbi:MAG: hypothetical protein O3C15_12565 [Proteobacteria bacterium]|nr:hypothetical protein [Pseudomonadota bacterium]